MVGIQNKIRLMKDAEDLPVRWLMLAMLFAASILVDTITDQLEATSTMRARKDDHRVRSRRTFFFFFCPSVPLRGRDCRVCSRHYGYNYRQSNVSRNVLAELLVKSNHVQRL